MQISTNSYLKGRGKVTKMPNFKANLPSLRTHLLPYILILQPSSRSLLPKKHNLSPEDASPFSNHGDRFGKEMAVIKNINK